MIGFYIRNLDDAARLTTICSKFNFDIDAIHGTQTIDAKSVMGVVSLLGKFITLRPVTDNKEAICVLEKEIKPFCNC